MEQVPEFQSTLCGTGEMALPLSFIAKREAHFLLHSTEGILLLGPSTSPSLSEMTDLSLAIFCMVPPSHVSFEVPSKGSGADFVGRHGESPGLQEPES